MRDLLALPPDRQPTADQLPTADLVNALLTTAPDYAANLFAQELGSGDILNALGMPIAGLFGLAASPSDSNSS